MAESAAVQRAAIVLVLSLLARPADARVQEYQIVRLLSYKTSCLLEKLEDRSASTGPMRFLATCENVTFYPNGIEILCADRDDDRSCVAATKEQRFDRLHLLDKRR